MIVEINKNELNRLVELCESYEGSISRQGGQFQFMFNTDTFEGVDCIVVIDVSDRKGTQVVIAGGDKNSNGAHDILVRLHLYTVEQVEGLFKTCGLNKKTK